MSTTFDPVETLRAVNLRATIIHDFQPLSESLEWKLSDLHWQTNGLSSFVSNEVPYAVNNSGALSMNAAATLLANCEEAAPEGEIRVLELGAGSGLFARSFLDEFRRLCEARQKPYFDQLTYYVSDASPRTVDQWTASRQFRQFEGRVVMAICNAMHPQELQPVEGPPVRLSNVRAIFANYLLDSLPTSIVRKGESGPEELFIRTQLTNDSDRLQQSAGVTTDEIRALVASDDPAAKRRLIRLAHVFDFDSEFRLATPGPPFIDEALAFGYHLDRVLLNHGALQCLETCREMLAADGFICFNDYGALKQEDVSLQAMPQRFGPSIAIGLNFPLIEHHFNLKGWRVLAPEEDEILPVHPRLMFHGSLPRTQRVFGEAFRGAAYQAVEDRIGSARRHTEAGRLDRARDDYEAALARFPRDWRILGEVAEFVVRETADFAAGERLARAALEINPWHSTWLLNILGDALFCLDRYTEAHEIYLRAHAMDPLDVRSNLNLAYTYLHFSQFQEALESVAAGLAHDRMGQYRERLLQKQQQILQTCVARWASEQEWMARRVMRLKG